MAQIRSPAPELSYATGAARGEKKVGLCLQMESRIQRPGGDLSKHRSNKACALGPGGGLNLSTMTY